MRKILPFVVVALLGLCWFPALKMLKKKKTRRTIIPSIPPTPISMKV